MKEFPCIVPEKPIEYIGATLRSGQFRRVLTLNTMASLSSGLRLGTLSWLLYDMTGSSLSVGISIVVRALPAIVLGPLGGAMADLVDRRILVALDRSLLAILAAITGLLVASGQIQQWHLLALSASAGILFAFSEPAAFAMLRQSSSKRWMSHAVYLRSLTAEIGETLGPFIAGIVIATLGKPFAFWIMTAGFSGAAVLLLRLPKPLAYAPIHDVHSILRQVSRGFSVVANTPSLRWVTLIILMHSLTGVAIYPILPQFSAEVLNRGAIGFGYMSAVLGGGLIIGSVVSETVSRLRERRGATLLIGGIVWNGGMVLFGFQASLWSSLLILLMMGIAGSLWFAAAIRIFQDTSSPEMRGRAFSVFLAASQVFPLGWLIGGALTEMFGIRTTLIISALASTPLALLSWIVMPSFRRR